MRHGILLMAITLAVMAAPARAELSAQRILDKADDHWDLRLKDSLVDLELLVYRESELRATYKMTLKYQDTYHVLAETYYPPRNGGEKMLQSGRKNFWLFLPNINKAVKISEANSLSNSDFSNTDLLSPRLSHEYTATLLGEEKLRDVDAYKLELAANDETSTYSKIVYWIKKDGFFPLRRDYYTFSGQLLKRLDMKAGNPELKGMLDTFVMSSVLEKEKKTVLRYVKHTPGVKHPEDTFLPSGLMKR